MDADGKSLNNVKWAAWGVVDIERLDRLQRRNYLRKVREELSSHDATLHPGGSTQMPWYRVQMPDGACTKAGDDAFRKICEWALLELENPYE